MTEQPQSEPATPTSTTAALIPSETWSVVKGLFWELQDLAPDEREQRLRARTDDILVRDYTMQLLVSADAMGNRFEQPAIGALGVPTHDDESRSSEMPTLVGRTLGKYSVVRRIGQGGMGAVYEAVRVDEFNQRVAIKTLWRGADSSVLLQRFRSERRILAGLAHPNIARLIDGGATEEGTPYLVMELIDGIPIDQYCDAHRLAITDRLDLFRQVCAAVQHAHQNLVVHRDLKPSNVLVTPEGAVKLLDFGVAKLLDDPRSEGTLTSAGLAPFTSAYASPEQLAGGPVSTSSDVYALGALVFVLLTGRTPFAEGDASAGIARDRQPVPPSSVVTEDAAAARHLASSARLSHVLQGDLNAITLTALRHEPARRYATVDAMSEDLHRYLRGERVLARPDTMRYRTRVFVRRRRALVVTAVTAIAALLVVSTVALWQARASRIEAARSEHIAEFLTLMTGAPDTHSGSPLLRRGTRETVTDMLDSALLRVPGAFPADARVRARLYTAIGASYTAQSRMRVAARVLDSAMYLARSSYGPQSDEFAEASIDAAEAAMHRSPVPVAAAYARNAVLALRGREKVSPELYARALATVATTRYLAADLRGTDSLSRAVIARELRRTSRPTMTRAWATRLRAGVRMVRHDWRGADSLAARAIAIADSLGGTFAFERLDAIFERSDVALSTGKIGSADSLTRLGLADAVRGYGSRSREAAIFLAQSATIARLRLDTARSRALADTALTIADSIPEMNSQVRIGITIPALRELWAQKNFALADRVASFAFAGAVAQQDPMAIAMGAIYAGAASVYDKDLTRAEAVFRRGLAACPASGDLENVAQILRGQLGVTVGTLDRAREADSLFATIPPAMATQARAALAGNLARKRVANTGNRGMSGH